MKMPDPDNFLQLSYWYDESAVDLIRDIMAQHTKSMLKVMRELVDERNHLRSELARLQEQIRVLKDERTTL